MTRAGAPHGLGPHLAAEALDPRGIAQLHVAEAHHQLRGERRGGARPVVLQPQHMRGIRRREAAGLHQALALQRGEGALRGRRHRNLADGLRPLVRPSPGFRASRGVDLRRLRGAGGAEGLQHELAVQRAALGVGEIGLQHGDHFRIARGQQRDRAPRAAAPPRACR